MGYKECILAVREAAKDKLSKEELDAIEQTAERIRKRIEAEGKVDGLNDRIREATEREAERIVIAAALQRKHAALNAIVRDRLTSHVEGLVASGLSPSKAMLAVFEGSHQGVANARKSVYALRQAYERRYLSEMLAEITKEKPHIEALVDDPEFSADVVREMYELRQGGTPGSTGNLDAKYIAGVFSKFSELSRVDQNRKGAAIGKLDGWAGPQRHNAAKIMKADAEVWARETLELLDLDRTFPDATSREEALAILNDVRLTLITGQGRGANAQRRGELVGPASLAKSLGKSRVLHFKDADAWLSYNAKYGDGGIFQGIISHQQHAAAAMSQLDTFGPNPEIMLGSFIDEMREKVRNDPKMSAKEKAAEIERLNLGTGGLSGTAIANAFLDMQGIISSPVSLKAAQIGQGVRNFINITSLGGATITAVPTDTVTAAAAGMFRGGGFVKTFTQQFGGLLAGRPKGEQKEIAFLLGEGADGLIQQINSPFIAQDGVPGHLHKLTATFFKWNGLQWATDVSRSVAARIASAEMGMRAKSSWSKLPDRYRQVLSLQGIDEAKWDIIRSVAARQSNGNDYITPDLMRSVPDDKLEPLIAGRMNDLTTKDPARRERARQRFLEDARMDLELDVARYFADETSFAVVETDAASRRVATQGTRAGTVSGEVARFLMQFKGFPIAFTQRVMGRALFGGTGATKGERFIKNLPHTGSLLAGLVVAGYVSMTMKDALRGQWPPRDISDPNVWAAAALQGGAIGIYGDFLFGETNRFGNSVLETLAGPAAGRVADVVGLFQQAVRGEAAAGKALNTVLNNTPFANLFYVRPAMDYLFLNSLREAASPGYNRRRRQRLRRETGQEYLFD